MITKNSGIQQKERKNNQHCYIILMTCTKNFLLADSLQNTWNRSLRRKNYFSGSQRAVNARNKIHIEFTIHNNNDNNQEVITI
jgi:hypothetical protein